MAGLLAARILLNHFERVTLVERDRFPSEPESRPGVPQASHTHVLLMRGKQILIDFISIYAQFLSATLSSYSSSLVFSNE